MESTGVYWKPVWHILQDDFNLILANPRMIKNVPGRKTDMKDAEWIAKLTRVGLVPPSFVPPEPIQDLRDYLPRLQKYHMHFQQFGDRNSFSKTDVDATFMRMKEDHMRNGPLKAGYNV
ncbi:IS110 family transposase [Listeria rocourtiae]|uniref:IS110 family transposase n=1 Tax=Listeria rocourtiae TaxID=647910 RepID=UPI001C8AC49F|nr:transposase [Listeria rocourtiae]